MMQCELLESSPLLLWQPCRGVWDCACRCAAECTRGQRIFNGTGTSLNPRNRQDISLSLVPSRVQVPSRKGFLHGITNEFTLPTSRHGILFSSAFPAMVPMFFVMGWAVPASSHLQLPHKFKTCLVQLCPSTSKISCQSLCFSDCGMC